MRRYTNWRQNEAELRKAVEASKSMAEVLRYFNLAVEGGNFRTIKVWITNFDIDTSHFTGQLWSKGKQLKPWAAYSTSSHCRKNLIKARGNQCEQCKNTEWNNRPVPIELHHIDGDSTNNKETNLQLLCPNCHALTDNYRNKKRK